MPPDPKDDAILDYLKGLKGEFGHLAEIVGVEKAMEISRTFGGLSIPIPKLAALQRASRDRRIRAAYDQTPDKRGLVRRLARQFDLTDTQIYTILKAKP